MVRPKQFDEDAALDAAILQFWKNGYVATSVRDLAKGMGISGTSVYNTFHDKKSLFSQSLSRYFDRTYRVPLEATASSPPREAIRTLLEELIETSLADPVHRGCLVVNSTIDVPAQEDGLKSEVLADLEILETFFRSRVEDGQRLGTIASAHDPRDLARLLLGALISIRVLSRVKPDRELLSGLVRPIFALLDSVTEEDETGDGAYLGVSL